MIFVLLHAGSIAGVMPFKVNTTEPLPDWKIRVLEAIGSNLSMALSKMQHQGRTGSPSLRNDQSLLVNEHDSIAQSLSYLRIQVARLEKKQLTPDAQDEIITELKTGLGSAYKELRELISAFRLKIDERGFQTALIETTEEFSRRCNLHIDCRNDLPPPLARRTKIHVLRSSVKRWPTLEKHAHASEVNISASISEHQVVTIQVSDNGIGIGDNKSPENHYGLIIMEDRAQSLDGTITIRNGAQGGTEVLLTFIPEKSGTDH